MHCNNSLSSNRKMETKKMIRKAQLRKQHLKELENQLIQAKTIQKPHNLIKVLHKLVEVDLVTLLRAGLHHQERRKKLKTTLLKSLLTSLT